ncbi:MAG: GNAT superfamily N-acetyltransferase [Bermanella sp.]|jgi:GNAT superfamily N-acetyltransferase
MNVKYKYNQLISAAQFLKLLEASTLDLRRPVGNADCIQGMLDNADLTYSAWIDDKLVGIARCVTDFHYCCYLSDLAVDQKLQHSGIGKKLIALCAQKTEDTCKLVLLASPAASGYYPKIGMQHMDRCWILNPGDIPTSG